VQRAEVKGGSLVSDNDGLTNIRNVLGFLLAGFGAILSFLGIRSSEVTTILRNDAWQASLIAFILLAGVLTAVWAIITKSKKKVFTLNAIAIQVFLLGVGALVIFFLPIGPSSLTTSGTISLVIGCVLMLAGTTALLGRSSWVRHGNNRKHGRWGRLWLRSATERQVEFIDVLIVASVLLTGIAAYGAMRLESKSQLSFFSQVGASFSVNGPIATASINIAASKLPQVDWIYVDVYAVPVKGIVLMNECDSYVVPYLESVTHLTSEEAAAYIPHCISDPCIYFAGQQQYQPYNFPNLCNVLLNGSIVPNATGDVDETLSLPFLMTKYQDIDIRAEVCSPSQGCQGNPTGQNSRLDWIISNSLIVPTG
jgi:hypothetical protein